MTETFCPRFDQVVERQATSTAIETDAQRPWTYAELQQRSVAIAGAIRRSGIDREGVVGIGLPKSPEYIASLIGIWRAGCAAMPIPRDLPPAQQQANLRRSRAAAVIDDRHDRFGLPVIDPSPAVETRNSTPPAGAEELAYVLFTSGSTGRPKGVAVDHRGLVPMLEAQIEAFQIDRSTRSLFYLSTAFDAALSDIGTVLLGGGTLVIDSDLASLTTAELMQRIEARGITYADLPPTVVTHAMKQQLAVPANLHNVVIGGETCPGETIRYWASKLRLINVYGPTEATVCTSFSVCDPDRAGGPSIGSPIAGLQYRLQPIEAHDPTGGELWISGPGLARGYIDDPVLTSQKFVTKDGQRWYRTGDHVQRNGGEYFFRGRLDRQFKLHGKLIEPAEIEQRLLEMNEVCEAVVVPLSRAKNTETSGEPALPAGIGALLRPSRDSELSRESIRQHLSKQLPGWMIPQHLRVTERMPRTKSGKPDLSSITQQFHEPGQREVRITNLSDAARLRAIWQHALRLDDLRWDDDFFLAGGDSLAALQVLAHAESAGIPLSRQQLLQHRTLRGCLASLESSSPRASGAKTTGELDREIQVLANSLVRRSSMKRVACREPSILLTGATGFLGTWVLDRLLTRSSARIVCLVRAGDESGALDRINRSREKFLGDDATPVNREGVDLVCGEITQPRWGVDPPTWERLSRETSELFHVAAEVHLMKSFQQLRRTNLDSLLWALQLVETGAPKTLHFASTLSVFVGTDRRDARFYERDRINADATVFGGYAQSKWAAERLLWEWKKQRPFPMNVYRLGLLTGDSRRGAAATSDQLTLVTRGLARIGMVPENAGMLSFDVTPVDNAAAVMCELSQRRAGGAYHVCGTRSIRLDEWTEAMRACGIRLREVPLEDFRAAVERITSSDVDAEISSACLSLCRRMSSAPAQPHREFDLFLTTNASFDAARTDQHLLDSPIQRRDVDRNLLTRMVRAMFPPLASRIG